MLKILTYNEIDKHQWQALVDQSSTATWFQTPEAYEFYKSVPEEMTPFAYGVAVSLKFSPEGKDLQLVGVVVGYITKARNSIKQFFTRRAIIVGGPLLSNDISGEALVALLNSVKKQLGEAIYIETRNFNDYSSWRTIFEQCGFSYYPHLNFHVDCSVENILSQMSESRRRQIKKAIKSGVEIAEAQSINDITAFYSILNKLYQTKVKTPLFPFEFFSRFHTLGVGKFLLVKYNEKVIGGIMCPILNKNTIYEWFVCGLDEEYKNQFPSVMATYAAIEYANTHGITKFDFMGAGKPNEAYGVRDFKARFGGEQVEYGRYVYVRKSLLYKIGKLGVKILKKK